LKRLIISEIEEVRQKPKKFKLDVLSKADFEEQFTRHLSDRLSGYLAGSLQPVINATGVVLHTGLGRAPISREIISQLHSVSRYSNLEVQLGTGRRGQRNDHLSSLLQLLTGAEDGLAVNNNAAAVMLMLNSLSRNKEVIISRGELVEIGGSFRIPEVIRSSGCKIKEIGTTNKTHISDYKDAISNRTGAIMICHPSNYAIQGFTQKPSVEEIVELGKLHDLPVIFDLGSGSIVDTKIFGSDSEPVVSGVVDQGPDLISFSGDKLLGGPQAGIIVGRKHQVAKCKKNQLLRALRLDKLMIKILQLVLTEYLFNESIPQKLDSLNALICTAEELKKRCEKLLSELPSEITKLCKLEKTTGRVGSGAYPVMDLETWIIRLRPKKMSANSLSRKLRQLKPAIFCYIDEDDVCIDLRAVTQEEEGQIIRALTAVLN